MSPRSACTRHHKESSEAATYDTHSGKATADETVERLEKNLQSQHKCRSQIANWEASNVVKLKQEQAQELGDAKR